MSDELTTSSEGGEKKDIESTPTSPSVSETEAFLLAVEAKTSDEIHKRLLKAARGVEPLKNLEAELKDIATEILYEN